MNHRDNLSTPADRAIVVPNNDTLYSSAWYDLRYGDLTIDVPPMDHPDRYWNVMVVDAYTHTAYVCRRHFGVGGTSVSVTFDPEAPPSNDDSTRVTIGTPTAWVILRVLVESPEDIELARQLQRSIQVTAPASHPHTLTEPAGLATTISAAGADYFRELQHYVEIDPPAPWHPKLSPEAQAIVNDPSSVADDVLAAAVEEGEKLILGRNYSAQDAYEMGMVNAVIPHDELEDTAYEWAQEILAKSPTSIKMLKFAFNATDDGMVGQQVFAGEATRLAYMTDEAVEGRDAFLEKRDPDWTGFPWYF